MKQYKKITRGIITGIGTAAVPVLQVVFSSFLSFPEWVSGVVADILIAAISAAVAAVLILFFEWVFLSFPYQFLHFRKKCFPIAKIEGVWIEIAKEGERVISIAHIEFNKESKKYVYRGIAYDRQGEVQAIWTCDHLKAEFGDGVLSLLYSGQGEYLRESIRVRNVGHFTTFSIDHLNTNNLTVGYGTYYDYDVNNGKSENTNNFHMYKLTAKDYMQILKKEKIETEEDWKNFVKAYYAQKVDQDS